MLITLRAKSEAPDCSQNPKLERNVPVIVGHVLGIDVALLAFVKGGKGIRDRWEVVLGWWYEHWFVAALFWVEALEESGVVGIKSMVRWDLLKKLLNPLVVL